jgi:long-chain acyl-CoA synthetase
MMSDHQSLSQIIAEVLQLDPGAPALEYERQWYTWADLAQTADSLTTAVQPGMRVGVLLRNRPPQVGLLLGLLRAGACVVAINPGRGADRVREELATLGLPAIAGQSADLDELVEPDAVVLRMASDRLGGPIVMTGEPAADPRAGHPGVAVEMLTSGTTGPPKRVPLTYQTFERVLAGAKYYESGPRTERRLRSGVAIVNAPLVHLGGLFRVLQCVADGRSFCLLEKFRVDEWVDAVRRHRPLTVSLVPAALRMVLEADLDPKDLSSLKSVVSGTAPLAPSDADAFMDKYGVPVLVSYAATEFGGGVAGWNLSDHRKYWDTKRGSVGRAHPGCELRVVDPESGELLGPAAEGLLEVKAAQMGDRSGWTRTTDMARIDEDGFVWILGRADQAIIRGGFKISPDDVRAALEIDSRVRGAVVVGRSDPRLGAVPVAAVELRTGAGEVTAGELIDAVSARLAPYELPAELRILDELPRTPSGKVDLPAVSRLLARPGDDDG